jgi:putative drug exporter of the RND superfamily
VSSLTTWVLAHKRIVVLGWLMLTVAGLAAAGPASERLSNDSSVPDREGWQASLAIAERYDGGPAGASDPLLPVVTLPAGATVEDPGVRRELAAVDDRLRAALPQARIASFASTGDRAFVSADGRTVFGLVYPRLIGKSEWGENPAAAEAATRALDGATVAGRPVQLTGFDALMQDAGEGGGPGVLAEAVIGGAGALLVLLFVFASFLAVVPLLMAFVAIMVAFVPLLALTAVTEVSSIVQYLIALIGLGVAIDYALIVVSRWREERSHGADGDEAVRRAMETAGRAVVFSGITVAIGLLALVALPLPLLRSMGYGGMLIPLVSVLAAITLLPVVLARFGARLDWPHRRTDDQASRAWTRWANAVAQRPALAAVAGLAVVAALALAAADLRLGISDADTVAQSGAAKDALVELEEAGIGEGALLPHQVLVGGGADPDRVVAALRGVDGVHGAVAPEASQWRRGGTALVEVIPTPDSGSAAGARTLDAVRRAAHAAGPGVRVGGEPASDADFVDTVYGSFPLMVGLIAVSTFVLLARAFRSLLLPAKAILLNVLSVAAAWGAMVLIWQKGLGSELIWGIQGTGSIPSWLPLMAFAFLFGLSMDYEVFILARMREEYDRSGSTRLAVVRGIGRTGRLVTSAALILFLAFVAMAAGPGTDLKMFATALAVGILVDATVIRALIVPAVVLLMGRWNWWLPRLPAPAGRLRRATARR